MAPIATANTGLSDVLELIRRLRHGPLRFLNPLWVSLGNLYRGAVSRTELLTHQRIGTYGPFAIDAKFAFSDFASWGGGHNDGFSACVEACRGKSCVLDVGAHIGLVTLPVASVMAADGRLVSFEPAESNRRLLLRHLAANAFASVVVEGALVGDSEAAAVEFYEMDDASGMNTVVAGAMDGAYRAVTKSQVTLDGYCERNGLSPQVIKIDVEGAELGVLRGARRIIASCRPSIFLSVHPRQIAILGETTEQLADLIESLGYDCRHIDGSSVDSFALREYVLTPKEN